MEKKTNKFVDLQRTFFHYFIVANASQIYANLSHAKKYARFMPNFGLNVLYIKIAKITFKYSDKLLTNLCSEFWFIPLFQARNAA